jgi:hypothetical protein
VFCEHKKLGLLNGLLENSVITSLEIVEREKAAVVLGKSQNRYVFSLCLVLIGVTGLWTG